jgi:hypothetical protein
LKRFHKHVGFSASDYFQLLSLGFLWASITAVTFVADVPWGISGFWPGQIISFCGKLFKVTLLIFAWVDSKPVFIGIFWSAFVLATAYPLMLWKVIGKIGALMRPMPSVYEKVLAGLKGQLKTANAEKASLKPWIKNSNAEKASAKKQLNEDLGRRDGFRTVFSDDLCVQILRKQIEVASDMLDKLEKWTASKNVGDDSRKRMWNLINDSIYDAEKILAGIFSSLPLTADGVIKVSFRMLTWDFNGEGKSTRTKALEEILKDQGFGKQKELSACCPCRGHSTDADVHPELQDQIKLWRNEIDSLNEGKEEGKEEEKVEEKEEEKARLCLKQELQAMVQLWISDDLLEHGLAGESAVSIEQEAVGIEGVEALKQFRSRCFAKHGARPHHLPLFSTKFGKRMKKGWTLRVTANLTRRKGLWNG